MEKHKKEKIRNYIFGIALIFLLLGFIPGFISYKAGLVWFVFLLCLGYPMALAVPDPDPGHEKYDPAKDEENDDIPKPPV